MRDCRAALDRLKGLPDYDDHVKTVRKRFARMAAPPDGEETDIPAPPETSED